MTFKSWVMGSVFFLQPVVWACPTAMPKSPSAIRVDDYSLGVCWLNESLQEFTKKPNTVTEKLNAVLSELGRYIPTSAQRLELTQILVKALRVKGSNNYRITLLSSLGQFHLLTPDVRAAISEAMRDKNGDIRNAAVVAASIVSPKDELLQKQILNAVLHDAVPENRYAAISGLYRRSSEAVATLLALAKSSKDETLQASAEQILNDWKAHPEVATTKSMAAIGDSISVGFFADTNLMDAPNYNVEPTDISVLWLLGHSSHEEQMKRSWSTGEKINSHFHRLKETLRAAGKTDDVELYSVARAGAKTSALADQIWQLDLKMTFHPDAKLIYVTLFMGSNDVCDSVTGEEISSELLRALDRLNRLAEGQKVVVLIPALPPIHELGLAKLASHPGLGGLTCEKVQQEHLKFCNKFTALASPTDFSLNQNLIAMANQKIEETVAASNSLPNLKVIFGKGIKNAKIEPELMAVDCFHPNEAGQAGIADILWTDVMSSDIKW